MKAVRQRLELAAVRVVGLLARVLPHGVLRLCGAALGSAFYVLDRSHRRVALANLAQCFPARSAAERTVIARRMFQHFGVLLLELLQFSSLTPEAMRARVDVDGEERVRAAYAKGKGVLFFTGHFGFWELHAMVHALLFQPIGVLARPLDNPGLHTLLEDMRQRTGNSVDFPKGLSPGPDGVVTADLRQGFDGFVRNTAIFSITAEEWPAAKTALEASSHPRAAVPTAAGRR